MKRSVHAVKLLGIAAAVVILLSAALPFLRIWQKDAAADYQQYREAITPVLEKLRIIKADLDGGVQIAQFKEDVSLANVSLQGFEDNERCAAWAATYPSEKELAASILGYQSVVTSINQKLDRAAVRATENATELEKDSYYDAQGLLIADKYKQRVEADMEDEQFDRAIGDLEKSAANHLAKMQLLLSQQK